MAAHDKFLHVYQCWNCMTVAITTVKHTYGNPLRCNTCQSYMKWLYRDAITTREEHAMAERGVVYNPGAEHMRRTRPAPVPCDNPGCKGLYSDLTGYEIDGVGKFCSVQCLDAGVKRHEAAMAAPKELMGSARDGE